MKDKIPVKTARSRPLKVLATIVVLAALMIITTVVTSGCGDIEDNVSPGSQTEKSTNVEENESSDKQFDIPSNGGYYSAH